MDPQRFDSLARALGAAKTRRGLLGGLTALGAGLLGARATDAQVSQASCGNVVCYNRGTKTVDVACTPGCVCCVYANGNSRCRPPGQCTGTVVTPTTTTTAPPVCADAPCPFGTFNCGPATCGDGFSLCVCTPEGGRACVAGISCPSAPDCVTSADCPSGSVCAVEICNFNGGPWFAACHPVCDGTPG